MGLAPNLTWEEIITRLKEGAEEILTNPILLRLFLQIHHGANRLLAPNQDEIFRIYGEQISGADLLAKLPWYKKIVGFLRNGLLTSREIFIADLSQKMVATRNIERSLHTKDKTASGGRFSRWRHRR